MLQTISDHHKLILLPYKNVAKIGQSHDQPFRIDSDLKGVMYLHLQSVAVMETLIWNFRLKTGMMTIASYQLSLKPGFAGYRL